MSIVDSLVPTAATLGGGFFIDIVIGYALKKVVKIVAVIVGLLLAGLAYLHCQQIAHINWNKLQTISEGAIAALSNLTMQIQGISGDGSSVNSSHAAATVSSLMTSFGIPLTGSMSAIGFTIGFMKG
jgi:uncharacterized membrane protein (Fun14 family)